MLSKYQRRIKAFQAVWGITKPGKGFLFFAWHPGQVKEKPFVHSPAA